jgi:hypothetical protein
MRRWIVVLAVVLLGAAAAHAADLTVQAQAVQVPAGSDVRATIDLVVEGTAVPADAPTVTDGSKPTVTFTKVSRSGDWSAARRKWTAELVVDQAPGSTAVRVASLKFPDGSTAELHYALVPRPKTLTWGVTPVGGKRVLVADKGAVVSFSAWATGSGVTDLRFEGTTLQEKSTGASFDPRWIGFGGIPKIDDGARVPSSFTIDGHDELVGEYTGAVSFLVKESSEPKSVEIAVYGSPAGRRWLGFVFLVGGAVLALLGGTFLRNRVLRAEAELPAARLRDKADECQAKLRKHLETEDSAGADEFLEKVRSRLSLESLREQGFVPNVVMPAFGGALKAMEYADFLQKTATRLSSFDALIERGYRPLAAAKDDLGDGARRNAWTKALAKLDEIASGLLTTETPKTPDETAVSAAEVLETFRTETGGSATAFRDGRSEGAPSTAASLTYAINVANAWSWGVAFVVAVVVGYFAMIGSNPAFGLEADVAKCFLWGFGIQAAGQQIGQLTPSSVLATIRSQA